MKRIISLILCLSMAVSVMVFSAPALAVSDTVGIAIEAVQRYVSENKNSTEKAEIEAILSKNLGDATVEAFYIKNAVNGVKDGADIYPLDIKGSDGAVAVFFSFEGNSYSFTASFPHETELVSVGTTAIVGEEEYKDYFEYDSSGNLKAIKKSVDKVVFPAEYSGKMLFVQNKSYENNVKVVIYNSDSGFMDQGFRAWQGLVAFQMGQTSEFKVGASTANGYGRYAFKDCPSLKYFKFPENISSLGGAWATDNYPFHRDFFYNCLKLETVVMPKHISGAGNMSAENAYFGVDSFYGTAVREVILPSVNNGKIYTLAGDFESYTFGAPTFSDGIRNIHYFGEKMSFARASAIAAASTNSTDIDATEEELRLAIASALELALNGQEYEFTVSDLTVQHSPNGLKDERTFVFSSGDDVIIIKKSNTITDGFLSAADKYVQSNGNKTTREGLLEAVKTVVPTAELSDAYFYIRHAIPSVRDNDIQSGYQLGIEGSSGSVSAVFTVDGMRVPFNTVFEHTEDVIDVKSYAIVGNSKFSDYFSYDVSGNVTDIKKPVEKIIFPDGYKGTMLRLTNEESRLYADRVKVVIYNGLGSFVNDSFYDWNGLIAFEMGNQKHNQWGFSLAANGSTAFAECDSLKYFKFPEHINTSGYNAGGTLLPNAFFKNSSRLENVVMPQRINGISNWYNEAEKTVSYGYMSLWGTALREIVLPKINLNDGINYPAEGQNVHTFLAPTYSGGTRNIHYYSDEMTMCRAVSLIASALSEKNCVDSNDVINVAKASIKGTFDSEAFADSLSYSFNITDSDKLTMSGILTVSDGKDSFSIDLSFGKALSALKVIGIELNEKFSYDVTDYSVTVDYKKTDITLEAICFDGTKKRISKDITGVSPIKFEVLNSDGKNVLYTVKVLREGDLDLNTILMCKKALLGIKGNNHIDIHADGKSSIIDLIRMKKLVAQGEIYDAGNVVKFNANVNGLTADTFYETLGYVNKDGKLTDTLFGSVTFMPSPNWLYSYDSENPRKHTKRDWSQFIYSNILQDGYNFDALNTAAGRLKQELNIPNYKVTVYVPLFTTLYGFAEWGSVDGVSLDFSDNADRVTAQKWLVEEMKKAFFEQDFKHLRLGGFYYVSEGISSDDQDNLEITLPQITEYIRQSGYISYFAPFRGANGSYESSVPRWYEYGFDKAAFQSNYFPGTGLPNASSDPTCILTVAKRAKALGAGMEMELCGDQEDHILAFKKYLEYGITERFMYNDFTGWWIQNNSKMLKFLCYSDDELMRSTYDEIYKFIKKTLVLDDIKVSG